MPAPFAVEPFPDHDHGAWSPVPFRTVASWPVGTFAENLAVAADGRVFVSLHSENRIDVYDPATHAVSAFAHVPAPVAGLAFDASGALWATGGVLGQAPGLVWRIDAQGLAQEWATIPDALFLNGATPHPNGRSLLICESVTGRVIEVDQTAHGQWRTWLHDPQLAPTGQGTPGANGIKVFGSRALISVTDRNLLLACAFADAGEAGALTVAAAHLRADDFAFDAEGRAYIATHPANTILRLAPDGARQTLVGPDEGAVGATAVAFGRAAADAKSLYFTTTGGAWSPYRGQVQPAKLVRCEVGVSGHPLLG